VTGGIELRVERGRDALAASRAAWDDLAGRAPCCYFQSWEWVTAWHEVLEPRAEVVLVEAVAGGRWEGVLPLALLGRQLHARVPLRVRYLGLAGSGRGAGDHLGPVVSSVDLVEPLAEQAVRLAAGRSVYLESVAPAHAGALNEVVGGHQVRTVACPAVVIAGAAQADDLWAGKVRKNVRRRDRMLAEAAVVGRWIGPGEGVGEALAALRRLHVSRWQSHGQAGLFDDDRMAFLRRLTELGSAPDGPWLYLLESGDGPIAALLGFQYRRTFANYKTGWDPDHARLGLGIALHAASMRRAVGEGLEVVDFLRSQGGHKYSLGATDRHDVCLLRSRGVGGAMLRLREEGASILAARTTARRGAARSWAEGGGTADGER